MRPEIFTYSTAELDGLRRLSDDCRARLSYWNITKQREAETVGDACAFQCRHADERAAFEDYNAASLALAAYLKQLAGP